MTKPAKKTEKKRSEKYDPKVKFEGVFEQMIAISVKQAERKTKKKDG